MTIYWRKKIGKIADSIFTLIAGCKVWPSHMFESLMVAFVTPFLFGPPWRVRHLPEVDRWKKSGSALQWNNTSDFRHHMRKFWA